MRAGERRGGWRGGEGLLLPGRRGWHWGGDEGLLLLPGRPRGKCWVGSGGQVKQTPAPEAINSW